MWALKSLFTAGAERPKDPSVLPFGTLFLHPTSSLPAASSKSQRKCIYPDAALSLQPSAEPFHTLLVATRAFSSSDAPPEAASKGQSAGDDEEDDDDDEYTFLLGPELDLSAHASADEHSVTWVSDGKRWEFVLAAGEPGSHATGSPQERKEARDAFEVASWKAMFERKYKRKYTDRETDLLTQFIRPSAPTNEEGLQNMSDLGQALSDMTSTPRKTGQGQSVASASDVRSETSKAAETTTIAPTMLASTAPIVDPPSADAEVLAECPAQVLLYDLLSEHFVLLNSSAQIQLVQRGPYSYQLVARAADSKLILVEVLSGSINSQTDAETNGFMWNQFVQGAMYTWLLNFPDEELFALFNDAWQKLMYQTLHKESWEKASEGDRRFVKASWESNDVEMSPVDEEEEQGAAEEEEEEDVEALLDPPSPRLSPPALPSASTLIIVARGLRQTVDSDSEDERPPPPKDGQVNSQLAVGMQTDRAFILRGDNIGVFKQDDDDMRFVTNITKLQTPKGRAFRPNKVMLHEQDSKMILMDPENKNSLYSLDVEYGKVVDEWKVSDNLQLRNIAPDSKFAQTTAQKTFVGTSHNALFRIDPRLAGDKLVESQFKQYVSKNDFSATATTADGQIAVASNKGDLRLFDSIGKNAKTALPALGDPIIGVDVSKDGRWIIATCRTYLLLIDTLIGEGRYKGSSGFDRSFPATSKPIPKRLTLKPAHVAYMDGDVSFTPARFNVGENDEKTIVTSTGPYVVSWNFKKIKLGRLDDYQIKKYADTVVADNFTYGNDRKIVVALPQDVLMVNKRHLATPTRASLSTPVKDRRTRSSIVDERY